MQANVYTRERKRAHMINMLKGHLPFFALPAAQSLLLLLQDLEGYQSSQRLNNNDRKQAI
jgi:hypothetical protein